MKCESREEWRTPPSPHPLLTHRSRRQLGQLCEQTPNTAKKISWAPLATLIIQLKKIVLSGSQYVIKFLYTQFKLLNDFPGLLFVFWSCSSSWHSALFETLLWIWSIWQNSFQTHSTGNTMSCLSQNLTYHKRDKKQTVKACYSVPPFLESGITNAFPVSRYGNRLVQTSAFCWS